MVITIRIPKAFIRSRLSIRLVCSISFSSFQIFCPQGRFGRNGGGKIRFSHQAQKITVGAGALPDLRGCAVYTPPKAVSIIHEIRLLYKKKKHRILFYITGLPCLLDKEQTVRLQGRLSAASKSASQPASSSMASRVLSAENRNAPVLLYTSTCPPTCLMMQSIR